MHLSKISILTIVFIFLISAFLPAATITKASGGSIKTKLSRNIIINDNSSLMREWITINDDSLPVVISDTVGVKTIYKEGSGYSSGDYQYVSEYSVSAKEAVSAIEIRFITFDIWGNYSRNLSSTEIVDMAVGTSKKFNPSWSVFSENEVSEFYASIAYIAQVRTQSGKVIKADPSVILAEAKKFSTKFSEDDLDPKQIKK